MEKANKIYRKVLKLKKKEGFTLVEVIVAMGIISILCLGLYCVVNMAIKVNSKNENDIKALQLAQSQVESIRVQIKNGETKFKLKDKDNNDVFIDIDVTSSYKKNISSKIYDVQVNVSKDLNSGLYKVIVKTKLENINSSKKETKIVTEIFGG